MIIFPEKKQAIAEAVANEFKQQGVMNPRALSVLHAFRRHYRLITGEPAERTLNGYSWFMPLFNKIMDDAGKDVIVELLCDIQNQLNENFEQNKEILEYQKEVLIQLDRLQKKDNGVSRVKVGIGVMECQL